MTKTDSEILQRYFGEIDNLKIDRVNGKMSNKVTDKMIANQAAIRLYREAERSAKPARSEEFLHKLRKRLADDKIAVLQIVKTEPKNRREMRRRQIHGRIMELSRVIDDYLAAHTEREEESADACERQSVLIGSKPKGESTPAPSNQHKAMVCSKCGSIDESYTAYCGIHHRSPHVLVDLVEIEKEAEQRGFERGKEEERESWLAPMRKSGEISGYEKGRSAEAERFAKSLETEKKKAFDEGRASVKCADCNKQADFCYDCCAKKCETREQKGRAEGIAEERKRRRK